MMKRKKIFQYLLTISTGLCLLLAVWLTETSGTEIFGYFSVSPSLQFAQTEIDADTYVDRGRLILRHHIPRPLTQQHKSGLPRLENLSQEQRYRYAIQEFCAALRKKDELVGYNVSQVYGYLADTYCSLAALLRGRAEKELQESQTLKQQSQQFFDLCFQQYRLALENNPQDLKYTLATRLVGAIITAKDYSKALEVIEQFERDNLRPNSYGDHELLRLKGEANLALGRNKEAGLAYEEWIKRGNVDSYLMPGDSLYEKLRNLQKQTGHPNNLPS
jgi:tetratricopeptide (TPR) repeat protein